MAQEKTNNKTGMFDFLINHSKKFMVGIICLSVAV